MVKHKKFVLAEHTFFYVFTPGLIGVSVGYSIAVFFLPGGWDSFAVFLRYPALDTTAPAWVYLITYPISLLNWPYGWMLLTFFSLLVAGIASQMWENSNWWVVAGSASMLWNIWLGNIEVFTILGLLISILVLRRRIHTFWLGLGWLALLTKPQVGLGLMLVLTWWIWKEYGLSAILWAFISSTGILVLTLLLWPGWVSNLIKVVSNLHPTWWNASVWPYGLIALPLAFVPIKLQKKRRLRMIASATLLGSPYFALYHGATLLTLTDGLFPLLLSWLPLILGMLFTNNWMKYAWLLPAILLAQDLIKITQDRIKNIGENHDE